MKKVISSFPLLFIILSISSCSFAPKEDQHPDVATLDELIAANKVEVVEEIDSTLMHTLRMWNDSLYYSKKQLHVVQEVATEEGQKSMGITTIKNEFQLKNIYTGKTYILDTVPSTSEILADKNQHLILNNILYLAPTYAVKERADSTTIQNGFTAIDQKVEDLKTALPEFDESIVYKWTNGRLPSYHEIFYYELDGQRFKTLGSECYRINSNPKYFYNSRIGIMKIK